VGDFDGDGNSRALSGRASADMHSFDSAGAAQTVDSYSMNRPDNGWSPYIELADLTGDGVLDLVGGDTYRKYGNPSDAVLTAYVAVAPGLPGGGFDEGAAYVMYPNAAAGSEAVFYHVDAYHAGQAIAGGPPEELMFIDEEAGMIRVWEGPFGPGGPSKVTSTPLPARHHDVVDSYSTNITDGRVIFTDVSGDGVADMVYIEEEIPRGVRVLHGDGAGGFVDVQRKNVRLPLNDILIEICDFDGDGDLDLLQYGEKFVGGVYSSGMSVRLNDGTGRFGLFVDSVYPAISGFPPRYSMADLDEDGVLDAVYIVDDELRVRRGSPDGALGPELVFGVPEQQISSIDNGALIAEMHHPDLEPGVRRFVVGDPYFGTTSHPLIEIGCLQFGCQADLSGDFVVGSEDLGVLLAGWGTPGPADLDGSGSVDSADLGILLAAWGGCVSGG